jgi:hypothetical protein
MTHVPRTVLHGAGQSAANPTALVTEMARGNMGHRLWDERRLCEMIRDTNLGKNVYGGGYAAFLHDFAIHGGAIGAINLGPVPAGFIVLNCVYDVITTYTTAGADAGTLALSIEGANDIVSAVAVSNGGNPWDAGRHQAIPDFGTLADDVKATIDRQLVLTIGGQAVTAGKMRIFLFGCQSTTW